jgi:hypothetical protein
VHIAALQLPQLGALPAAAFAAQLVGARAVDIWDVGEYESALLPQMLYVRGGLLTSGSSCGSAVWLLCVGPSTRC